MEIIEIGAVMVENGSFTTLGEYQTFIKPVKNPTLTEFCKTLTTITQSEIDDAPSFSQSIKDFKSWLYQYESFAFCSWGDYDKNQLKKDCFHHNLPNPISAEHFNIKKEFSVNQGLKKKLGMAQALKHAGIPLTGMYHRGIDDAKNMAKLMPWIV